MENIVIPEGVEIIEASAFNNCTSLTGILSLPSTLKVLGSKDTYTSNWDGVFYGCNFVCELIIPDGVEVIGGGTFGPESSLIATFVIIITLKKENFNSLFKYLNNQLILLLFL